ncbi:hypothetical protein GGI11_005427 [Coemansia sp. RSA 2049]|nr:hypothetical protein GGI11_005427 [Coemansia sp. RSA 2049]
MPVHSDSSVAVLRRGSSSQSAAARRSSTRNRNPRRRHLSPASSGTYRRRLMTQSVCWSNADSSQTQMLAPAAPLCPFPSASSEDVQLTQLRHVPRSSAWFANEAELANERLGRSASCCEPQVFSKRLSYAGGDCADYSENNGGSATDSAEYQSRSILRVKRTSLHHRASSTNSLLYDDTVGVSSRDSHKSCRSMTLQRAASPMPAPALLRSFGSDSENSSLCARTDSGPSAMGLHSLTPSKPVVVVSSETALADMPPPAPQFLKQLGTRRSDDSLRHRSANRGGSDSTHIDATYASSSENSIHYSAKSASIDSLAQETLSRPYEGMQQAGSSPTKTHRAPHFTALIKAAHMLNSGSHSHNDDVLSTRNSYNVSSRLARFTRRLIDGLSFGRRQSSDYVLDDSIARVVPQSRDVSSLATFGISVENTPLSHSEDTEKNVLAFAHSSGKPRSPAAPPNDTPGNLQKSKHNDIPHEVALPARRLQAKLALLNNSKVGGKRNVNLTLPTNKGLSFLPARMAMPMLSPASASLSAEAVTATGTGTGTAGSSARDSPQPRPSSAVAVAAAAMAAESNADAFFDIVPFDSVYQPLSTAPAVAACAHNMLCQLAGTRGRARSRSISVGYSGLKDHGRGAMTGICESHGIHESPPASLHADVAEEWGLFVSHCLRHHDGGQQTVPSIDSRSTFVGNVAESINVPSSPGSSLTTAAMMDPGVVLPKRWFSDLDGADANSLHALIAKGVPGEFRRQVWMECAGALDIQPLEVANHAEYAEAIELDLHRTVGHGLRLPPGVDEEAAIRCLRWVLCEYASINPEVGYCQGMNKIAFGLLSAGLNMTDSLLLLRSLLDGGILPSGMFRSPLDIVQNDQQVLEELVCRRLPQLSMHMRTRLAGAVPLAPVTVTWFMTLFVDCLPEGHRLRVWDILFTHGYPAIFQACLAIIELNQEALLQCKTPMAFYTLLQDVHHTMLHVSEDDFAELAFGRSRRPWVMLREIEEIRQLTGSQE